MKLYNLESVGNVIDENGVTYPMLVDGGYDIFGALSQEDIDTIEDILGNPTDTLLDDTAAEYYAMKAELAYGI